MKISHLIRRLYLLFLLLYAGAAHAFDPCTDAAQYTPIEQRYKNGLLFKVEKCKAPVSYVFGTMHLARPGVTDAARSAFITLYTVDAAGFELAEDEGRISDSLLKSAIVPPGDKFRLSSALGKKYFNTLLSQIEFMSVIKGNYVKPELLDRFRPWAVATLMQMIGEDAGTVLDEKIRARALAAGKPIFGLETLDEQKDVLSGLPEDVQIHMLEDTIDHYSEMLSDKEELVKAYIAKDGRKIQSLEDKEMGSSDDQRLQEMLMDRLLIKRNKTMVQRLLPRLKKQSVMVSVGVMHLLGKEGILRGLEQNGYFITPLP